MGHQRMASIAGAVVVAGGIAAWLLMRQSAAPEPDLANIEALQPVAAAVSVPVSEPQALETQVIAPAVQDPAPANLPKPATVIDPGVPERPPVPDLTAYKTVVRGDQNPDGIPFGNAGFMLFDRYASLLDRRPEVGLSVVQREIGISEQTASELMNYIHMARAELATTRTNARRSFCNKRSGLVTLYDVQRELTEMNREVDEARERLIHGTKSVLDSTDMAKLEAQIEVTKRSMTITRIDKDKAIFRLGRSPEDLIKQLCDEM